MEMINIPEKSKVFSPIQLELLKLFAHNPSDEELIEIKTLIGQYYSNKLRQLANKFSKENNWTEEYIETILNDPKQ